MVKNTVQKLSKIASVSTETLVINIQEVDLTLDLSKFLLA
jgi:hypothetical protein